MSHREYSGLVLLSSCYHTTKKLQQFFTNARLRGQYPATYRLVLETLLCWHGGPIPFSPPYPAVPSPWESQRRWRVRSAPGCAGSSMGTEPW